MFRLVRFIVSCIMFAAFVWFATSVPLGKHTLWGHLVRIARTDEARDLASGARETAADVAKRMKDEARKDPPVPAPTAPSTDEHHPTEEHHDEHHTPHHPHHEEPAK